MSFDVTTSSKHGGPSFDLNSKNNNAISNALLAIQELQYEDGPSKHDTTHTIPTSALALPAGGKTELHFDSIFNTALVDEHDLLIKDLTVRTSNEK